jgi:hypothetical protein
MNSIAAVIALNFSNEGVAFFMFSHLMTTMNYIDLIGNDFKALKSLFL